MWIFGYGSLVWKADFPYEKCVSGYIEGYVRRFWQFSVDHRGVPSKPGRVVTLVKSTEPCSSADIHENSNHIEDNARVWGVAYKISEENVSAVIKQLDVREKNGYEKVDVTFYPAGSQDEGQPFTVLLYLGTEQNKWFAGPSSVEDIARTVVSAVGPSGSNKDYVYNLASAMRRITSEDDQHLFAVEEAVRKLDTKGHS